MAESIPGLLRAYDLHPRKRLGQNFLTDPIALERIVDAAELTADDTVVEVGAGLGTLTRLLVEQAGRVLAVELDDQLVGVLRDRFSGVPNLEIIHGDILELADLGTESGGYKVVANLPYYITSAVLRRFLSREPRPTLMVVTLQREVAQRIVAGPGKMSILAVSVQLYGQPRIVARIPAGAFYPSPKVDSTVVRIDVSKRPTVVLAEGITEEIFFRTVRAGFSQKRKTLRNSLSAGLHRRPVAVEEQLAQVGVDPGRRAQTLSLDEWGAVTAALFSSPG